MQSWELKLVADVTASWKQRRCIGSPTICRKIQLTLVLKDLQLSKCSVMSANVSTVKHRVKQQLVTWKQLFVCFLRHLKELSSGYKPLLNFDVKTSADMTEHSVSFSSFKTSVYCVCVRCPYTSVVFSQWWCQQWASALWPELFVIVMLYNII